MREPADDPTTHPAERRLFPILFGIALGVIAYDISLDRDPLCLPGASSSAVADQELDSPGVAPALPAPAGLSRPVLTHVSESR